MSAVTELRDDFPDRLSPMLVKELRQGLRAKTFVAVFLALQGLLGLILLSAGAAASSDRAGMVVSQLIFVFFSLAVLVIQPLRGIAALSTEIKSSTIDLMVLTRLSSWRIVAGKWIALVGQSSLIFVTIIPYLILRYYFGGMNLFAELLLTLLVFLLSAALTALTVGLSASQSVLVRGLLPLAGSAVLAFSIFGFGFSGGLKELIEVCSLQSAKHGIGVLLFVLTIAYLGWNCLSLGASLIAPIAENHATLRRVVALAVVGIAGLLMMWQETRSEARVMVLAILAAPAITLALTEPPHLVPTVCLPFVKRGATGRMLGRFLYPGWPSGVLFTGAICTLCVPIYISAPGVGVDGDEIIAMLGLLGSLLLPGVLTVFLGHKVKERFSFFILALIASGVLAMVLGMLAGSMGDRDFLWLFVWNPIVFMVLGSWHRSDDEVVMVIGFLVDGIYLLLLLFKAFSAFRQIRETEREALAE